MTALRDNHMVRNSMYSLLSTGLQAGLGFAFWVIAARIFTTGDVGRATSLISATAFIGNIALFGLNSTMMRYLPTTRHRDLLITVAVVFVGVGGTIIALAYVVALPLIAPHLQFMDERILFAAGFVVLTGATTINKLTDYIFIASRRTGINAFVDGGIGGVVRLLLLPVLAFSGTFGLYCASGIGYFVVAVVSVVMIGTHLHGRPRFKGAVKELTPLLRFSGANYLGNIFNLAPTLIPTLIVLDRLGTSAAAYYYMAFQIANLLYSGAYAVEENFLAEGSHDEERLTHLMWRAAKMLAMMAIPAAVAGALLAHFIMLVFGHAYAVHGSGALELMALAAIPIAAQNWLITVLRLTGQLLAITVSNAVYAIGICGGAWLLASHGLTMVGGAWLFGSLVSVAAGAIAVLIGRRRGLLMVPLTRAIEDPPIVERSTTEVAPPAAAKRHRRWPALLVALAALIGLSLVTSAGRHQWALSLIRQPSGYTSLSFQNAAALPNSVEMGDPIHLTVVVANHEGREMHYSLLLRSMNGDGTGAVTDLGRTALAVPSEGQGKASFTVRPTCTASPCKVQVSLPGHSENIDVLLKVKGHPG